MPCWPSSYIPGADSASDPVSSATNARNSLLGLKTCTGRAATSTGAPVRGLRAVSVFRRRILEGLAKEKSGRLSDAVRRYAEGLLK